jgi:type IV pilus assembly protein PilB
MAMNDRNTETGKKTAQTVKAAPNTSLIGTNSIEQSDELFISAIALRASDIHLDMAEYRASVTLRIGTFLSYRTSISHEVARSLVGRIKVLARLRLDVNDKSQDGSFTFRSNPQHQQSSAKAYIRVSTAPTVFGENVVCRIFSNDIELFDLAHIGLADDERQMLLSSLSKDSGLILVSGPTGSGKTTTLYACLRHLAKQSKVIVTLEDPVEVIIPGIRQIIVQQEHGFGFSHALRSVLRQDPDIIMVGEIRDRETAELAIQSALTGHLVLATIHAVSALGIIDRLNSMGVRSDSCAQVINLLISQRKVVMNAVNTPNPTDATTTMSAIATAATTISAADRHQPKVVFEMVQFSQKFKSALMFSEGAGSGSLAQTIREEGILLLKDRVENLFHEGLISKDEMNKYIR